MFFLKEMIIKYRHLCVKVINTCSLTVGFSLNADAAPEYEYPIIIMMYLEKMASRWPQCAVRFYERFSSKQEKKEQNDPIQNIESMCIQQLISHMSTKP